MKYEVDVGSVKKDDKIVIPKGSFGYKKLSVETIKDIDGRLLFRDGSNKTVFLEDLKKDDLYIGFRLLEESELAPFDNSREFQPSRNDGYFIFYYGNATWHDKPFDSYDSALEYVIERGYSPYIYAIIKCSYEITINDTWEPFVVESRIHELTKKQKLSLYYSLLKDIGVKKSNAKNIGNDKRFTMTMDDRSAIKNIVKHHENFGEKVYYNDITSDGFVELSIV